MAPTTTSFRTFLLARLAGMAVAAATAAVAAAAAAKAICLCVTRSLLNMRPEVAALLLVQPGEAALVSADRTTPSDRGPTIRNSQLGIQAT